MGEIRTLAPVTQSNDLANRPLQPLEYHSMAERVGFEPTVLCSITGFQDQLLKPLGHLSVTPICYHIAGGSVKNGLADFAALVQRTLY